MYKVEEEMYTDIIKSVEYLMKFNNYKEFKIYKTWKEFSPDLKKQFPGVLEILGPMALPDLIVVYNNGKKIVKLVIEAKLKNLVIKDIAQAKIYGDIFDADKTILVSTKKLRQAIKNYYYFNDCILKYSRDRILSTVVLKDKMLEVETSFPVGEEIF